MLALIFAAVLPTVSAIARTNYALIVGVAEYPQLPRSSWLVGPRNDAILVRDYLTTRSPVRFEPGHVTLLADGVEGATAPTLDSILSKFNELAEQVAPDDFVYVHFSGHGFQQPALHPDTETDGLDEIFLPRDTRPWLDRSKGLPNALIDDRIGEALSTIRAKGAFVWAVFDACYSSTATRAAPGDFVMERKIDRSVVGMPDHIRLGEQQDQSQSGSRQNLPDEIRSRVPGREGGLVAFFAAQTNETTPEMPLPRHAPDAKAYGLFTYTLFSKLAENPAVTYRQLAEGILQHYAGINRTSTTPLFEGDLDAPVFGVAIGEFIPQWPIKVSGAEAIINAGMLYGLVPGTRLAVLEGPGAKIDEVIGYMQVKSADNFSSRLVLWPIGGQDQAGDSTPTNATARPLARSLGEIPSGSYARVSEYDYDFTLRVARPIATTETVGAVALVNNLLDGIAADKTAQLRIAIVNPGEVADLRLAVLSEATLEGEPSTLGGEPHLWFLPESGAISLKRGYRPPSIKVRRHDPTGFKTVILQQLTRIYRATNLGRISENGGSRPYFATSRLDVSFTLTSGTDGRSKHLSTTSPSIVVPGDRVRVRAMNESPTAVDLNILYIGSDYSITHVRAERMQPSNAFEEDILEFTDSSFGRELIVVVLTEARPLTPTFDLSYLAQEGFRGGIRGGGSNSVEDLIGNMSFPAPSRGGQVLGNEVDAGPRGSVMLFPLRAVPTQ